MLRLTLILQDDVSIHMVLTKLPVTSIDQSFAHCNLFVRREIYTDALINIKVRPNVFRHYAHQVKHSSDPDVYSSNTKSADLF